MLKSKKNILVLISGSIACFKTCSLISSLVKEGHKVRVAASKSALKFIGLASLEGLSGQKVFYDEFQEGQQMDHIHWMNWADAYVLAPASANTINSMAAGITTNVICSLFLAYDFKKPFLLAPAMNTKMLEHPCTKASIHKLQEMGLKILSPEEGSLACGEIGSGRMLEPEIILEKLKQVLS